MFVYLILKLKKATSYSHRLLGSLSPSTRSARNYNLQVLGLLTLLYNSVCTRKERL